MNKGYFFTFSGMEATGKTTIVKRLLEEDVNSITTRDPHPYFRPFLLENEYDPDPFTEMLIFMASKSYNYYKQIIPSINKGINVYSDRWIAECIVYQGIVKNVNIETIFNIYYQMLTTIRPTDEFIFNPIEPTIEFIFICDPKESLKRAEKAGNSNRFENYGIDFHHKVLEGFNDYTLLSQHTYRLIDTTDKTLEEVYNEVKEHINYMKGISEYGKTNKNTKSNYTDY